MANVLFSRTSDPSSKPITDGQLIFDTSGNGKMYLDVGSKRMEMGGARTIDPVLNSSSENPIQNKAVAGVMLDNMTDVNAVTGSGFLPDALSIKELDTDLQGQINTLNSNLEKTKQNFYFPSNSIVNITFGNYKTSAIIFVCLSDADAVLYVYSNGYLANIKSSPIVNVTLSSDFKTITLKNNSSASNGYLGILQTGDTTLTIA